jgi:SpoVK/Ycf46/Vps4 family AAA+-type ATPase
MHAHTDQKATINQLLIELNNIGDSDVVVIAATNYLSGIDSALKRSGRLDWKIPVFPPNQQKEKTCLNTTCHNLATSI